MTLLRFAVPCAFLIMAASRQVHGDDGDWLGTEEMRKRAAAANRQEPVESGVDLGGGTTTVKGATVQDVSVPGLLDMFLFKDGKTLCTLSKDGAVRLIELPSLKEKAKATFLKDAVRIMNSASGIVVRFNPPRAEHWLLDETTLAVKKKSIPSAVGTMTCSPKLSVAFVGHSQLQCIEIATGKELHQWTTGELRDLVREQHKVKSPDNLHPGNFDSMALTPDGAYLVVRDTFGIFRFKVSGSVATLEEASPNISNGQSRGDLRISADSVYLSTDGNAKKSATTAEIPVGTVCIFKVRDLSKPAVLVKADGASLAIDGPGRRFVQVGGSRELNVFNSSGKALGTYEIDASRNPFPLAHPDGYLLVAGRSSLLKVELPK